MIEKPIKVDDQTDRLVADLAHFLGRSKKSVVRDAVQDFARAQRALVGTGVAATTVRLSMAHALVSDGVVVPAFGELPICDRISLRRTALIGEFARLGASNIRIHGPLARGEPANEVELVVDTDLDHGSAVIPALQHAAQQLLATPTHVVSTTALGLFDPDGLRRVLAASRAL